MLLQMQSRQISRNGDILLKEGQSLAIVGRSALYKGLPMMCVSDTLVRFRAGTDVTQLGSCAVQKMFKRGLGRLQTQHINCS